MTKKIFIIWGWVDASNFASFEDYLLQEDFNPYEEKLKWWKDNLLSDLWNGFEVIRIPMPNSHFAEYNYWKIAFQKALPYFGEKNILVWHSLWGTFLLKYLSENNLENLSQIHLVAPASQDTPDEKLGSFELENLEIFKKYENITNFYFSKNDYCVPFSQCLEFQKILKNTKFNIFEDKGHFRSSEVEHFEELVSNINK